MPRKVTRRGFLAVGSAFSLAALTPILASCGQAPSPTPAPSTEKPAGTPAASAQSPKPAGEVVELKFNCRTGAEEQVFTKLTDTFMQQNPNIKVTIEAFSPANLEYSQKISVMVAGGTEGDIMWMSFIEQYVDYASRNSFLAIDDYAARDNVDFAQWYKPAVEMLRIKNALYALPLWSHSSLTGLFYNADLFESEGIPIPDDTWDKQQHLEAAIKLTKRTGSTVQQLGFNPGTRFFIGLSEMIKAYGGEPLSSDGTKMTFDQPEAREAIKQTADYFQTHQVAPIPGQMDVGQLVLSGKLATQQNGYWGKFAAKTTWKFNWGIAPLPKGPAGTNGAFLHTDANAISKRTKFPDQAWEYHKMFSTKEAGMVLWENGYIPGSRPDVWSDPKLMEDPTHAVWVPLMTNADQIVYPANFRLREFEDAIHQTLTNVWVGKMSVDEGIAEAMRVGQQILDNAPAT